MRNPFVPGFRRGAFEIIEHIKDDLYRCKCLIAGHEEVVRKKSMSVKKCTACQQAAKDADIVGQVFGSLQPLRRTERMTSSRNTYYLCCCIECGFECVRTLQQLQQNKKVREVCPGCKAQREKVAAASPLKLTDEQLAACQNALCTACMKTLGQLYERHLPDVHSESWQKFLTHRKALEGFGESDSPSGLMYRIAENVAKNFFDPRTEIERNSVSSFTDEDGQQHDIFDVVDCTPPQESDRGELYQAALDFLHPEEKQFMVDFVNTPGIKSRQDKQRFAELKSKVTALLAEIEEGVLEGNLEEGAHEF